MILLLVGFTAGYEDDQSQYYFALPFPQALPFILAAPLPVALVAY
ncbi:MAG TPA: hypothetical protein VI306_00070 [Pyrinomonadaceae bacterium]